MSFDEILDVKAVLFFIFLRIEPTTWPKKVAEKHYELSSLQNQHGIGDSIHTYVWYVKFKMGHRE